MKKHISILLTLLCLAGWAHAQSFSGVWNPPTTQFGSTPNTNIEYRFTQTGDNLSGEIIHKKEGMKATVTGKLVNGVAAGTLNYDKHQFASLDQKFRLFTNPKDNTPTFMHESTKGAKVYGGKIFKNQTASKQLANQTQAVGSLQKGGFSAGSSAVVQQATASPKLGVAMAIIPKKTARDIGGYYRIEGLFDQNGIKRNLYVHIKNYPDANDNSKAYGEALVVGEAYGIGSPEKKFFTYETNGDKVTVMFDPIFEDNKKSTMVNGSILNANNVQTLKTSKYGYRMVKTTKAIAEANSKATDYIYKVTIIGILIKDRIESPKLYGNIRVSGTLETRTDRKKVANLTNQSDLIWNVSQSASKAIPRNRNAYHDKQKDLFFANGYRGIKFFKFTNDIDIYSSKFFPIEKSLSFRVRPEWLNGFNQRFSFTVSSEILDDSGNVLTYNFGKKSRRVYLHDLNDFDKLGQNEKSINRSIISTADNTGIPIETPYYYQINGHDNKGIGIFANEKWMTLVFKVEKVD